MLDVLFNKAVLVNDDGNIAGLIGIITDITKRKAIEREREKPDQLILPFRLKKCILKDIGVLSSNTS